jgi:hypothetical protein
VFAERVSDVGTELSAESKFVREFCDGSWRARRLNSIEDTATCPQESGPSVQGRPHKTGREDSYIPENSPSVQLTDKQK